MVRGAQGGTRGGQRGGKGQQRVDRGGTVGAACRAGRAGHKTGWILWAVLRACGTNRMLVCLSISLTGASSAYI